MIKRLFIAFAMLTAVAASASAQFASDGYIDRYDDDWLHRGYRGSVWGGIGPGNYCLIGDVTTSHGFQFNNWFYLGAGLGYSYLEDSYDLNSHRSNFVCFANPQFNLPLDSRFSPFLDWQIGPSVAGGSAHFFTAISLGCRCALDESWGLNLSAGYYFKQDCGICDDINGIMFRLGVDFNL